MKFSSALIFFGLVAAIHAKGYFKDGQEYNFIYTLTQTSGTGDVATHISGNAYKAHTRIQRHGNDLNIEFSDVWENMYVGNRSVRHNPYHDDEITKWVKLDKYPKTKFSVKYDFAEDGKFKSMHIPTEFHQGEWEGAKMGPVARNLWKGFANLLQINYGKHEKQGLKAYKAWEPTIHGDCEVSYIFTDEMIYKTVAHMKDCKNRTFRYIDDWRGLQCDADVCTDLRQKNNTDGLWSGANTQYKIENGEIKMLHLSGSLVSHMYEKEGMSYWANVNATLEFVNKKSSSNDIKVEMNTADKFETLRYEWADQEYKWDLDRDLKAREPYLASGDFKDYDQNSLKQQFMKGLERVIENYKVHDASASTVHHQHMNGVNSLYWYLYYMDYKTLKSIGEEYFKDRTPTGVTKSNMFNEYLGNTGTTASALVIRDFILKKKFHNDRDAARVLTAVPFHIRRPNKQLVREFEQLMNWQEAERFVEMTIPLSFGHLIRVTCMRAGHRESMEQKECWRSFAAPYVQMFWQKFKDARNRDEKHLYLDAMTNIGFGGQSYLLKTLINGTMNEDFEFRAAALMPAGLDNLRPIKTEDISRMGVNYFFPVFANQSEHHEVRIKALTWIMWFRPTSTDFGRIMSVLYKEKDYEVINYVYSIFEQFANSINPSPCWKKQRENAEFFLRFMKQYRRYETDYRAGVSKTWIREYQKEKYGYGGTYQYTVIGSKNSSMPLEVNLAISSTYMNSYWTNNLNIRLRIEGVSKYFLKWFTTMDPTTWKTADLKKIFRDEMKIRARPEQPVRAWVQIMVKGAVVFSRSYDETSVMQGGRLREFFENFMAMGNDYRINHQRMFNLGNTMYEQPTELGHPVAYIDTNTWSLNLRADVKRGNARGLMFRHLDYEIHVLAQANVAMMFRSPLKADTFGIFQSRVYHVHAPRKIVVGVHPQKKTIQLSISRPHFNQPWMYFMHAQTMVTARRGLAGKPGNSHPNLRKFCPNCMSNVIITKGPEFTRDRIVWDTAVDQTTDKYWSKNFGFYTKAQYFDCDMDITSINTRGRAFAAFTPFNKNPKNLFTSVSMGLRQIAGFLAIYPRVEKCGIFGVWSQSKETPTTEFEISVTAKQERQPNNVAWYHGLFFGNKKHTFDIVVKAKAPLTRTYRVQMVVDMSEPRFSTNKVKIQFNRAPVSGLYGPYTACFDYKSEYPKNIDAGKPFHRLEDKEKLFVKGEARLQYGPTTECDMGDGEVKLTFQHETTNEGYENLQKKWYYKKCMDHKNSDVWKKETSKQHRLPICEPCHLTMLDANTARKYHWDFRFVKMEPYMKMAFMTARSIVQAGMLPNWDDLLSIDHSKITKIEAKTSTVKDAQTNDKITMTISKQETPTYINSCTTNILDNPDVNDFESGKTDIFTGSLLGECINKEFMSSSNELKLTLKTTKSNGWMMEYVKIFASDGKMWMCKNSDNKWLDTDHFTEYSINCIPDSLDNEEIRGLEPNQFMIGDITFHGQNDEKMDIRMETKDGVSGSETRVNEYKDYQLNFEWFNYLTNLKYKNIETALWNHVMSPCQATTKQIHTLDNVTYTYDAPAHWTLLSGDCGPKPTYAVFTKKKGEKLDVMAYFGGHTLEITASKVKINGQAKSIQDKQLIAHEENGKEIFQITKFGSYYFVMNLRGQPFQFYTAYENHNVIVVPGPQMRGQHCGLCGNFNRNQFDEWTGKDGWTKLNTVQEMVEEWKWK